MGGGCGTGEDDTAGEGTEDEPSVRPLRDEQHALVLSVWAMVTSIARRLRRSFRHVDEDDLAQWAQEGVIEAISSYDADRGPFDRWAWQRGYGRALDEARREQRGAPLAIVVPDGACSWASGCAQASYRDEEGLHGYLARRHAFTALREAVGTLDSDDQLLLRGRYLDQQTWADVGGAIGVSERQAKRRDIELRGKLRRALRVAGIEEPPPFEIG